MLFDRVEHVRDQLAVKLAEATQIKVRALASIDTVGTALADGQAQAFREAIDLIDSYFPQYPDVDPLTPPEEG